MNALGKWRDFTGSFQERGLENQATEAYIGI